MDRSEIAMLAEFIMTGDLMDRITDSLYAIDVTKNLSCLLDRGILVTICCILVNYKLCQNDIK